MNCLTDNELQSYLDKELHDSKYQEADNHLKTCDQCASVYERLKKNKAEIFGLLDELNQFEKPISIPNFKPTQARHKKIFIFKVAAIAASLLLLIGFGFVLQRRNVIQNQNLNIAKANIEINRNADPNQMYHNKQMSVIITDASGDVVQTFIME